MHELRKRNLSFGPKRKDEYVEKLYAASHKGGSKAQALAEKLLMNALIEARSCERFRLLSKEISDPGLKEFYYELMIAEAGHYKNFISLAKEYHQPELVEIRWRQLLAIEAEIIKKLDVRGDRMH
jgi:tRNA-(ms[2]io[6]A)-hydroxylase